MENSRDLSELCGAARIILATRNFQIELQIHPLDSRRTPISSHDPSSRGPEYTPEAAAQLAAAGRALVGLKEIVDRLRGPDGCPWDREQTPESLTSYLLEEAHEVAEAIREGDPDALAEELGDLLLNVFLQARIGEERRTFTLEEVGRKISDKLVRRHPHVFGDGDARDSEEVRATWEEIKRQEKPDSVDPSVLRKLPASLPALERAQRWGVMAAEYGFDWPTMEGPLAKVREELAECEEALSLPQPASAKADASVQDASARDALPQDASAQHVAPPAAISHRQQRLHEELGDLLLSVTSVCRHCDVNAEAALSDALQRFKTRFGSVEAALGPQQGRQPNERASLEEMERLWQEAKSRPDRDGDSDS